MKKTLNAITSWLHSGFSVIFFISFSFILLNVIFNKSIYDYSTINLILPAAFFIFLFIFSARLMQKKEPFFKKHYIKILIAFALLMLTCQLCLTKSLRFEGTYDFEVVYKSAIKWAEESSFVGYSSPTCHSDYFYIFPNNLGSMAFLALFFRIARLFNITDYFLVASIVNAVLSVLSMVLASLICRRLFGTVGAISVLILFAASPPFYLIAPVFYTDSLSLFFPLAAFYLVLKLEDCQKICPKIIYSIIAALLLLTGALIKATVLIFAVATIIYFILKRKLKTLLTYSITTALIVSLGFAIFNGYIYSVHLDKDIAKQKNQPIYYWLDTAFHQNGEYNNDVFWNSNNIQDPDEREEYLKKDLLTQLKSLKPHEIYRLFERKSARAFGDGTYALSDFLDDSPLKPDKIHDSILYDGKNYKKYSCFATSVFIAIQLLMLLSVSFKKPDFKSLIPQLCVFGIMFFLLFWEVNSRYITTFIPFIFIASAGGICRVAQKIKEKTH